MSQGMAVGLQLATHDHDSYIQRSGPRNHLLLIWKRHFQICCCFCCWVAGTQFVRHCSWPIIQHLKLPEKKLRSCEHCAAIPAAQITRNGRGGRWGCGCGEWSLWTSDLLYYRLQEGQKKIWHSENANKHAMCEGACVPPVPESIWHLMWWEAGTNMTSSGVTAVKLERLGHLPRKTK